MRMPGTMMTAARTATPMRIGSAIAARPGLIIIAPTKVRNLPRTVKLIFAFGGRVSIGQIHEGNRSGGTMARGAVPTPHRPTPPPGKAMILEGVVTTVSPEGVVNVAPMGPRVGPGMTRLLLRPFTTSQTYRNLRARGEGVFHVTDDVLLIARAAVGEVRPPLVPATAVRGFLLADACRFYEFRVASLDDRQDRTVIDAEVVASGTRREFFGFNRAKHAVIEAAILATRVHLPGQPDPGPELDRLAVLVDKTGGPQEREAFDFLRNRIETLRKIDRGPTP